MELPRKAVVIGLDGADPRLVEAFLDAGDMPALAALRDRGTFLPLRSTLPPVSAPAWATFMTGRAPGGHGVFGFVEEDGEGGFALSSLSTIRGKKLWEAAAEAGKRTAVLNVPVTFPPPEVPGLFVSGMLTPPGRPFTNPPEEQARIEEIAPAYAPDIDRSLFGDPPALLAHLTDLIDARAVVFEDVLRRCAWDLFVGVFTETDRIQHHFWRDGKDEIREFFRRLDGHLGRLFDAAPDDALVLVMSDHGFTDTDRRFYANAWLREEGYLRLKRVREDKDDYEARRFHAFMGEDVTGGKRKRGIFEKVAGLLGRESRRVIDWSKTKAYLYSASSHGIEINLAGRQPEGIVTPEEYEPLRRELVERLSSLRHPETGEPVFDRVLTREEAYEGPFVTKAPDIVLAPENDRYRIVTRVDAKRAFRQHRIPQGYHGETGLLFAAGPGVAAGARIEPGIEDVMPTVLWALDLPVPAGIDGRPRTDLFEEGAEAAREVRFGEASPEAAADTEPKLTPEEEEALKDALRGLGQPVRDPRARRDERPRADRARRRDHRGGRRVHRRHGGVSRGEPPRGSRGHDRPPGPRRRPQRGDRRRPRPVHRVSGLRRRVARRRP
jgi:predicted AlkP superfamily phosphohydrolase/phosphomutase